MFNFLKPLPDAAQQVPPNKVESSYKKWQFRVLLSTSMIYIGYYISRLSFTAQQNEIRAAYGFSLTQMGFILSMFGIGYGVSKLIMGTLADRSNANRYIAFGLLASSVINVVLGSTKSFTLILLLMLMNSILQGMGAAAAQRSISLWFGRHKKGSFLARGTAYSIWSSAHNFGAFAAVASINLSVFMFGPSVAFSFYTASAISVIIAIISLWLGSDRPATQGLPTIEEYSGEAVVVDGEVVQSELTDDSVFKVFTKYILKNKLVMVIILVSLSLYVVRFGIMSWIPGYLTEHKGFSQSEAKWLFGIFELASVPGVILLGYISDLLKGRRAMAMIGSLVLLAVDLTAYFYVTNHAALIVILLLLGNLIYAPITIIGLMVNEAVPKFAVGMSTGAMGFAQYVFGEVIGTLGVASIAQTYGWAAADIVIYLFTAIAIGGAIYIMIKQNSMLKEA
jgi:OPA family glycerol-3-phosphate transporter-like MFS transporter